MSRKAIFFDIDGTLLSSKNERHFFVQPSTWKALEQLKQNGHIVAISSGRPERFIHKYFPGIFSNYVAMNGAHVVVDGKTVFEEFFSPTEVREFMQYFDQYGCWYNFVGNSRGWARHVPPEQIEPLNESYGMPGYLQTEWEPEDVHASIIDFVFRDDAHYEQCKPAFQEPMVLNKHPGSLAADLSFKGKDKSRGVKMFLQQAGIAPEDAYAIGDGYNDITMMKVVGHSIAMGNAVDELKEVADYVTADILDDGLYKAFEHYDLLLSSLCLNLRKQNGPLKPFRGLHRPWKPCYSRASHTLFRHPHKKGAKNACSCVFGALLCCLFPLRTFLAPGAQFFEKGGQHPRALLLQHAAGHPRRMVVRKRKQVDNRPARTGLPVPGAEHQPGDARIDDRPSAHGAGFQGHIKRTLPQPPAPQGAACAVDGLQFRMAKRIFASLPPVSPPCNHTVLIDHHRAHGNLPLRGSLPCELQRLAHKRFIPVFQNKPSFRVINTSSSHRTTRNSRTAPARPD